MKTIIRGIPKTFDTKDECRLFLQGLKGLITDEYGCKVKTTIREFGGKWIELHIDAGMIQVDIAYRFRRIGGGGSAMAWVLSDYDQYGMAASMVQFKPLKEDE